MILASLASWRSSSGSGHPGLQIAQRRHLVRWALALALLLLASPAAAESPLITARPYYSRVPARHDPARPAPLLLLLHPYYPGDGRRALEMYDLAPILDEKGLLVAAPDGTVESASRGGKRFWNATERCCDFDHRGVDDVAYLDAVVADMRARYRVDERRIFVLGYSNGGYMTHRLLCDRAATFAAGASLAGAGFADPARCRPAVPSALLEVHGDADELVPYRSAEAGVLEWGRAIGCANAPEKAPPRDLLPALPGAETAVLRFACPAGAAELWTVQGGAHRGLAPAMRAAVEFLLAHPKASAPAAR